VLSIGKTLHSSPALAQKQKVTQKLKGNFFKHGAFVNPFKNHQQLLLKRLVFNALVTAKTRHTTRNANYVFHGADPFL
jgi:hypothetical protein